MRKMTRYTVDHTKLNKGIYKEKQDGDIIVYDVRTVSPKEMFEGTAEAMDPKAAHAIEHIGSMLLRNANFQDKIIYWGPMGGMTGFNLITRDLDIAAVAPYIRGMMKVIAEWDQDIPATSAKECGNPDYFDLEGAKAIARDFSESVLDFEYDYFLEKDEIHQPNVLPTVKKTY